MAIIFRVFTFFGVDDSLYGYPQVALHVSLLVHDGDLVNEWNRVQEVRQVYKAPVDNVGRILYIMFIN